MPPELKNWKQPKDEYKVRQLSLSHEYAEISAAKYWDMLPWEFRNLPAEQKGELMAYYLIQNKVDNYYSSERMKKIDDKHKMDKHHR